jgi:hypothetical protein
MSVINCYYIIDVASLCELVSVSDSGGLNINYFQISTSLPQYQLMTHSQYFLYRILSSNLCDGIKWLREGSFQFINLKIFVSTNIEAIVANHA